MLMARGVRSTAHDVVEPWTMVTEHAAFSARDTGNSAVFIGKMWLSNGYPDFSQDLWSSSDGATWEKAVEPTPYDIYSQLTVYNGKLWAISSTVWSSEDGVHWVMVRDNTPFIYGQNLVVNAGRMWVLGNGSEVWSSTDGVDWTCATHNAPYGDRAAPAVVAFDGKLWLMGGSTPHPGKGYSDPEMLGYLDLDMNNDVWSSVDGANWTLVTSHAPWLPRMWVGAQPYAGRMWIIGGYDNDLHQNMGDTWYTTDGVAWQEVPLSGTSWSPRHYPTTFVFDDSLWLAAGNSWPFQNDVWKLSVVPLVTTSLSLSASADSATYGDSITFTATVTPAGGSGSVTFQDGSTPMGTVEVSSGVATLTTTALGVGNHSITASYSGDDHHEPSEASITTGILPPYPPAVAMSFEAPTVALHAATKMTFNLSNPNGSATLTGIELSNTLPAGLIVATPNGLSGACGAGAITAAAGSSSISLSGAVVPPGGTCSFGVNVVGTTAGVKNAATSVVTSLESGNGNSASGVVDVLAPPAITMSFGAATIPVSGNTSLDFTITNPSVNDIALTGVGFSDAFPAGLVVANSDAVVSGSCGGAFTATAGASNVSLLNATLAANASCTFSIHVSGIMAGIQHNTAQVSSSNGGAGDSASASLEVLGADLTVTKSHSGDFVQGEASRIYTIVVNNIGPGPTTGTITVVDTLPSGLTATGMVGSGWTCDVPTVACTRSDTLPQASSASPITLTVRVASNAAAALVNTATVSGGGETNATNDVASDPTTVDASGLIAPTNLIATATSSSQVVLTWNGVTNATNYRIFRSAHHQIFSLVGGSMTTSFTDSQVAVDTAYIYFVEAVDASNRVSAASNVDLATTTVFSDDPIVPGTTVIRAAHLTELETAIDAVREAAALPPVSFSEPKTPGGPFRASQIKELRSNLNAARSALGLLAMVFTDPILNAGDTIKATHFQELRAGVK